MRSSNILIRTTWRSQSALDSVRPVKCSALPDDVFYPQLGSPDVALQLPLHGGWDHVQLQELVELVGGDLGSVALPEARGGPPGATVCQAIRATGPPGRRVQRTRPPEPSLSMLTHSAIRRYSSISPIPADPDLGAHAPV